MNKGLGIDYERHSKVKHGPGVSINIVNKAKQAIFNTQFIILFCFVFYISWHEHISETNNKNLLDMKYKMNKQFQELKCVK